jgi:hypothetical protein
MSRRIIVHTDEWILTGCINLRPLLEVFSGLSVESRGEVEARAAE